MSRKKDKKETIDAQNVDIAPEEKAPETQKAETHAIKPLDYKLLGIAPEGGETTEAQKVLPVSNNPKNGIERRALLGKVIGDYFFGTLKKTHFHPKEALQLFNELGNCKLEIAFPKFPDSPLHFGLHAMCKGETREFRRDKDNNIVDTVARQSRAYFLKTEKVGIHIENGFYVNNPSVKYDTPDKTVVKRVVRMIIDALPESRKAALK